MKTSSYICDFCGRPINNTREMFTARITDSTVELVFPNVDEIHMHQDCVEPFDSGMKKARAAAKDEFHRWKKAYSGTLY